MFKDKKRQVLHLLPHNIKYRTLTLQITNICFCDVVIQNKSITHTIYIDKQVASPPSIH